MYIFWDMEVILKEYYKLLLLLEYNSKMENIIGIIYAK